MTNQIKRAFLCCIFLVNGITYAQQPALIKFGWDYPDVDQLSSILTRYQNTPFDGICFSLQRTIMEAFDTGVQKASYFEYDKLQQLKWGKYTHNFIILRGYAKTGGSWFDDAAWEKISKNMRSLSKAMTNNKVKGILFDPEYYLENKLLNPWTYSKEQYPAHDFPAVQAKVKKRGSQFIKALQAYKQDLSFLSIWLTSLIAEEKKYTALQDTRHALLLSFIEGILEGKYSTVTVVDGNEYAYWNYKPSQFLNSREFLRRNLGDLVKSKKAKSLATAVKVAQPIFYDGLLAVAPSFEKKFSTEVKWKWLEENIRYAMATSDGIAWFYSERVDWWRNKVNDTLRDVLQHVKNQLNSNSRLQRKSSIEKLYPGSTPSVNDGKGYFYFADVKTPMQTGKEAFSYKLNITDRRLTIDFKEQPPDSVMVYLNNRLVSTSYPRNYQQSISLPSFSKGILVILSKYKDNLEASAILVRR